MFINNDDFFLTEVFFVFERERKDFQVQLKLNSFSQREKETKITSSDNNSELPINIVN